MTKIKASGLILLLSTILYSCKEKECESDKVLFPSVKLEKPATKKVKLSSLFTDFRIVHLEDTDRSLIGGMFSKFIKRDNVFYVRSNEEILLFDNDGKYLRKLDRQGSGPGEYEKISDFDVIAEKKEIWIACYKSVLRYGLDSLDYLGKLDFDFYLNQLKYVNDDCIFVSTADDEYFKILTATGKVLKSYFEQDPANSGQSITQFCRVGDIVAYHLASTNNAVCYNLKTGEFDIMDVMQLSDDLLSADINRSYCERYGYMEQSKRVSEDYTCISTFKNIGDQKIFILSVPGKKRTMLLAKKGEEQNYTFFPEDENTIVNDIVPNDDLRFLMTLTACESDDSFLFIVPRTDPLSGEELNPCLLDVFSIE